jgi:hypothetical protein
VLLRVEVELLGLELHGDLAGLCTEFQHELVLADQIACFFEIGGRELEETAFSHGTVEVVDEHTFSFDFE